jgi:hypothetical protein
MQGTLKPLACADGFGSSRLPEGQFRVHLPLGEVLTQLGLVYFGTDEFPLVPQMTIRPEVDAETNQVRHAHVSL